MATIQQVKSNPKVELVDDERALGNGVIVTLKQGWTFSPGEDNRVRGADTFHEARAMLRSAQPFAGPYDA